MIRYSSIKRLFDVWAASAGLTVLFPLLVSVGVAIKLEDGGPVFFRQKRIGQFEKPFFIYKFRSMIVNADTYGPSITHASDNRKTKIGKIIRKYKIDEFPQLFNVLKGEMSLVGPRPEVPEYYPIIKQLFPEITKIKPGITDYAAILFSNEEEILNKFEDKEKAYVEVVLPQKIKLYKKYYEQMSFSTDIKIILATLIKLWAGEKWAKVIIKV